MRIAIITNTYPPRVGGLEQHLQQLATGLAKLGNDVTVITIDEQPGTRLENGVRILIGKAHLPISGVISFPTLGTTRRLASFLSEGAFDAVSVHTRFFPMTFVGLRAAHMACIPVVHTEHGSGYVASSSTIIALASRVVDNTLGRYVLRHAERVLGVSQEAASFARRLGAKEPKVFYNAIGPRLSPAEVPDRPERLVFVGRLVDGKGWDTFLRAVARLRDHGRDIEGIILGDGSDFDAARSLAEELRVDDVVQLRGRVSPEHVRSEISGATLVNPTVLSEGFQTTLLEALAEDGRVVTFDVPGAKLLRTQGMPVLIAPQKSTDSLVETLELLLDDPPPAASAGALSPWTWEERLREFSGVLADVAPTSIR